MTDAPSIPTLRDSVGISQSYASMILAGTRIPPEDLAIRIYRQTGWKASCIANLTPSEIDMLEALKAKAAA